jgi:hypothetical protein
MSFARTKIQPPRPRAALIEHETLQVRLADVLTIQRLVLLCAPAGYGKTTLLAQQVARLPPQVAVAWIPRTQARPCALLRVKCDACCHEHLASFICKRGDFCLSCGARRMMIESAAHLVDHVLPEQPIRRWVLTCCTRSTMPERHPGCCGVVRSSPTLAAARPSISVSRCQTLGWEAHCPANQ